MKVIRTLDEYLEAINPFQQKVLAQIHRYGSRRPSILYRGQKDVELVSKIGHIVKDKKIESPITFERNCLRLIRSCLGGMTRYSDWDLIALSQHYGIETRFLDWSSNSLVALWFAVNSRKEIIPKETPVVWILETVDMDFEIPEHERSPIPDQKGAQTVIFTPDLIDSRMYTQDSYLMRQIYERIASQNVSSIRPVDKNPTFRGRLHKITITNKQSDIQKIIDDLAKYGYTRDSLIPDSMWDIIKEKIKSLANDYKGN